jgi:hypothetical protein
VLKEKGMQLRSGLTIGLLVSFMAAACARSSGPDGGSGSDPVEYPTGASDLVLRVSYEGGFVPIEWNLTQIPMFSLYGDGRIVLPGAQIEIYPGPALPAISTRRVTEAGMQEILREALKAGIDTTTGKLSDTGSVYIADAPTTVITLNAEGRSNEVRVYALGELPEQPQGMSTEEWEIRQKLSQFVTKIGLLDQWLPEGSIGPEESYAPRGSRIYVGAHTQDPDLPQPEVSWPLSTALANFGEKGYSRFRCGTVQGEDWDALSDAASTANQLTPWSSQGESYRLLFRPLLPDETAC